MPRESVAAANERTNSVLAAGIALKANWKRK